MPEQTRATLRQYFSAGQLPTEAHFADLVDSMLNMKDEGFHKTPLDGLQVTAAAQAQAALASLYRDGDPARALWRMRFGEGGEQLQFDHGPHPAVLSLDSVDGAEGQAPQARVGIGTPAREHALEVAGVLGAQGRTGTLPLAGGGRVPADGRPHALLDRLTGCQAFEVVAGVGGQTNDGRYALLHAIVLNAYHPRRPWWRRLWPGQPGIRITSAHYGRRCDRLLLAWDGKDHGKGADYRLCIRTGCDYGEGVWIRAAVTRLWHDEAMAGSVEKPR